MSKRGPQGQKPDPKSGAKKKPAAKSSGAAEPVPASSAAAPARTRDEQARLYDKAMKLFLSGDFAKAREAFDQVVAGPSPEIVHAARTHRSVCDRRLASAEVVLEGPEEHYNYAIALINQRRLPEAQSHLMKALDAKGGRTDHLHYALAICIGLQGDPRKAAEHLQRAIALDPKNRAIARNDPDFESFTSAPEIRQLLERTDAV
jgi:tetratricopeptide (TPR) repeat protein